MMKKFLLGCMMALCAISANAQFEAGTKYLNLSTSSLSLSYSKNDKMRLDFGLTGGLFVANDWMLYVVADYNHKQLMYTDYEITHNGKNVTRVWQDEYQVGLGGRYYIEQNGIYLGLGLQFAHTESNYNNLFLTPEIGYAFFLNQYVTIEPAVYYHMSINDFSGGSKVGLKLGFGFYF